MEILLTCPQLMSEDTLRSVLKDRCIQVGELDKMDKVKLVELFKRVALPLPQRKCGDEILRKTMQNSRSEGNMRIVDYDKNNEISTTLPNGKLKSSIDDRKHMNEPIRLNSCGQNDRIHEKNERKRQNDVPIKTDTTKRQKITWP